MSQNERFTQVELGEPTEDDTIQAEQEDQEEAIWQVVPEEDFEEEQDNNDSVVDSEQGQEEEQQIIIGATDQNSSNTPTQPIVVYEQKDSKIFRNIPIAEAQAAIPGEVFGARAQSEFNAKGLFDSWKLWLLFLAAALLGGYFSWKDKKSGLKTSAKKQWNYILKK